MHNAKQKELSEWRNREVYSEVENIGQELITLRWVCTPKIIDGKPSVKARLCARGFQEQCDIRSDSPTCSREGIRVALSLITANDWKLNSLDITTAFLQGRPITREVFVLPPKEAKTDKVWLLKKTVYGLNDASRSWYLKLHDELLSLNATPIDLDQGIFCWYQNNKLVGIAIIFVDDILWAGCESFPIVIEKFRKLFKVGKESNTVLDYIGVNLKQNADFSITISQNEYTNNLEPIDLDPSRMSNSKEPLEKSEKTALRAVLGQLNWLSGMSRPEISFMVSNISSRISSATIHDILEVNKVVKFVKQQKGYITIQKLDFASLKLVAYSDASFNNVDNGNSQGGQIVFMSDKYDTCCPITWSSNKIKRVARSTLAAETLSFTEAADTAFFISKLLENILHRTSHSIPIFCITDSQSLFEMVGTSHVISDRQLRVEVSALRQMVERQEITTQWVCKEKQLADVLTKKGASYHLLMNTLQRGLIQ